MTTYTLTLLDVRGVQPYVFGANELKQNLGASQLVEEATHDWVYENLPCKHNALGQDLQRFDGRKIEVDGLDAEVVFAGGGNVALLFAVHDEATAFSKRYSKKVLACAPGLGVAIGHATVDWDQPGALAAAWDRMHRQVMLRRKEGGTPSLPLAGLGVTAECGYTGAPAVAEAAEEGAPGAVLISAEVQAKKEAAAGNNGRLKNLFKVEGYEFPGRFDELGGERGKADFIAVVHADGNGMGSRVQKYTQQAADSRDMVERMRGFSMALNARGTAALKAVCDYLLQAVEVEANPKGQKRLIKDSLGRDDAVCLVGNNLPIRPIVFGGDDVAFVCEGRLGLALAKRYLEAFNQGDLPDGIPGFACAGVAIVHTHFPFAQAYALAEDLCRAAKHEARSMAAGDGAGVSLIHWHYAVSGLIADWEDIQRRQYTCKQGDLNLRPLIVNFRGGKPETWRTWQVFTDLVRRFRSDEWCGRRNKIKALRLALRQGQDAVKDFTHIHGKLPPVPALAEHDVKETGWYGGRCLYFDALDADDLLIVPREGQNGQI